MKSMEIDLKYGGGGNHSDAVKVPLSKSVALRADVLSMVCLNSVVIEDYPLCEDYLYLKENMDLYRRFRNSGEEIEYMFGDGAAPLRFFLAFVASQPHFHGIIDGSDQLRNRPLAPLVDALRTAGAKIEYVRMEGRLPIRVKGAVLAWPEDAASDLGAEVSSQFISALMMASLIWEKPFILPENLAVVSAPYVEMTRRMIDRFINLNNKYLATGQPTVYKIEGDWSAASYFYELILADPDRTIYLESLTKPGESVQGDAECVKIFDQFGVKTEFLPNGKAKIYADTAQLDDLKDSQRIIHLNMSDTPDLVPAVAVGLCCAGMPFYIDGIGHLRHKESNRLESLTAELAKAGFRIDKKEESLAWRGKRLDITGPIYFDSHNDHRIAMALSILAVKFERIKIKGAEYVAKSFPEFFDEIEKLGFITTNL